MTALRKLRERCGLTQVELARAAGISTSYLSKLESNRAVNPTAAITARIAHALSVRPGELFLSETSLTSLESGDWERLA